MIGSHERQAQGGGALAGFELHRLHVDGRRGHKDPSLPQGTWESVAPGAYQAHVGWTVRQRWGLFPSVGRGHLVPHHFPCTR